MSSAWSRREQYEFANRQLAARFTENIRKFTDHCSPEVCPAGPRTWRTRAARSMGLEGQNQPGDEAADPGTNEPKPNPRSRASRLSWAMLIARIYDVLPQLCPHCASPMRIVAFITQPVVINRILTYFGQPVEPPPITPAREVQLRLPNSASGRGPPPANDESEFYNTDW